MNPLIKYLLLEKIRLLIKIVKKYPTIIIVGILFIIFGFPIILDIYHHFRNYGEDVIAYSIFIYMILKLMQNNPIISINLTFISFKILKFKTLKLLIYSKIILNNMIFFFIICMITGEYSEKILIAIIFNILSTYLGFVFYQKNFLKLKYLIYFVYTAITIYCIYTNSLLIPVLLFIASLLYLISIKSFNYTKLYPYYSFLFNIGSGLSNKNANIILQSQEQFIVNKSSKNKDISLKFYG
ncbi:TPA: hypothetical protein ACOM7Y_002700, partial [Staphylococcus aureus]